MLAISPIQHIEMLDLPPKTAAEVKLVRAAKLVNGYASRAFARGARWREVIRLAGEGLVIEGARSAQPSILRRSTQFAKRIGDVIGALAVIVVLSPLIVGVAIAVKLTSPGPVLFYQDRLGRNGRWFKTLKFRTMVVDADERLRSLLESDEEARREFDVFHKIRNDPRVTPIGAFLRKYSLDELPQLFNVLMGQISLVGPRAYLPFEVLKMDRTERMLTILQIKPGLTGFWQVGGRSDVSFDERIDMDVFYIRNWSIGLDLYLLANTVWILTFGRGCGAS